MDRIPVSAIILFVSFWFVLPARFCPSYHRRLTGCLPPGPP
jgi:hypothetical protein